MRWPRRRRRWRSPSATTSASPRWRRRRPPPSSSSTWRACSSTRRAAPSSRRKGALSAASSVAGDSRVTAPFAGRVRERLVEVGDLAAPGRPLLQIESEGGRRLAVDVPETLLATTLARRRRPLPVAIDARADLGKVAGQGRRARARRRPDAHTVRVKLQLPAGDARHRRRRPRLARRRRARRGDRAGGAVVAFGGLSLVVVETPEGTTSTRAVSLGRHLDGDRRRGARGPRRGREGAGRPRCRAAGGEPRRRGGGVTWPPARETTTGPASSARIEAARREALRLKRGAPAAGRRRAHRARLPRLQADAAAGRRGAAARRLRRPGDAARGGAADQGADDRRLRRPARGDARRRSSGASSRRSRRRSTRSPTSSTSIRPRSPPARCSSSASASAATRTLRWCGCTPSSPRWRRGCPRVRCRRWWCRAASTTCRWSPIRSTRKGRRRWRLRQVAAELGDELGRHPQVAQVTLLGGERRVVRVSFDRDRLAQHQVSILQAWQALGAHQPAAARGELRPGQPRHRGHRR